MDAADELFLSWFDELSEDEILQYIRVLIDRCDIEDDPVSLQRLYTLYRYRCLQDDCTCKIVLLPCKIHTGKNKKNCKCPGKFEPCPHMLKQLGDDQKFMPIKFQGIILELLHRPKNPDRDDNPYSEPPLPDKRKGEYDCRDQSGKVGVMAKRHDRKMGLRLPDDECVIKRFKWNYEAETVGQQAARIRNGSLDDEQVLFRPTHAKPKDEGLTFRSDDPMIKLLKRVGIEVTSIKLTHVPPIIPERTTNED